MQVVLSPRSASALPIITISSFTSRRGLDSISFVIQMVRLCNGGWVYFHWRIFETCLKRARGETSQLHHAPSSERRNAWCNSQRNSKVIVTHFLFLVLPHGRKTKVEHEIFPGIRWGISRCVSAYLLYNFNLVSRLRIPLCNWRSISRAFLACSFRKYEGFFTKARRSTSLPENQIFRLVDAGDPCPSSIWWAYRFVRCRAGTAGTSRLGLFPKILYHRSLVFSDRRKSRLSYPGGLCHPFCSAPSRLRRMILQKEFSKIQNNLT